MLHSFSGISIALPCCFVLTGMDDMESGMLVARQKFPVWAMLVMGNYWLMVTVAGMTMIIFGLSACIFFSTAYLLQKNLKSTAHAFLKECDVLPSKTFIVWFYLVESKPSNNCFQLPGPARNSSTCSYCRAQCETQC